MKWAQKVEWSAAVRDYDVERLKESAGKVPGSEDRKDRDYAEVQTVVRELGNLSDKELVAKYMPDLKWHSDWPWSNDVAWVKILGNLAFVPYEEVDFAGVSGIVPVYLPSIGFAAVFIDLADGRQSVIPSPGELSSHSLAFAIVQEKGLLHFSAEQEAEFRAEVKILNLHYSTADKLSYKLSEAEGDLREALYEARQDLEKRAPKGWESLLLLSPDKQDSFFDAVKDGSKKVKHYADRAKALIGLFERCEVHKDWYEHIAATLPSI